MKSTFFLAALAVGAAAYLEPPPTTAASSTIVDCSYWAVVASADTCASIATQNFITLEQFTAYNPVVGTSCKLVVGNSYCVEQNYGFPPVTTTSSAPVTSTTSAGNGVSTPTPIQAGMTTNCNKFYLVKSGDECGVIASSNGITIANFYAWNPAVGNTCSTLWLDVYVCVGVLGSTGTTTSRATTTTSAGNGISTPTPIQTGMVKSCNSFYLVKLGDECATIASSKGISLANFYLWNPAIGNTCSSLWLDTYVCVGIVGGTTITTSTRATTTSAGNGISTPTPIQTGMTKSCNTFYLVKSGDECATIAASKGISLANFYLWNPAIGSTCSSLWLDTYVCVNVIGGTTTTSTTMKATTTAAGNGIATPTPVQTGMYANCKKFHLVVSGDQCGLIATAAGITLANFYAWNPTVGTSCTSLWLGYYVCIGI